MELAKKLDEAQNQLKEATASLQSCVEFTRVQEAEKKVRSVEELIKGQEEKFKKEQFESKKNELQRKGHKVVVGHTTSATNHHGRTSDDGEPYTFLIVAQGSPKVLHVSENSRGIRVFFLLDGEKEEEVDPDWIVGSGETEQEAWEDAIDNLAT